MTLGDRIKHQRLETGLTQEKVAEALGVSRQAVTKWETNQAKPSTDNLFKLAKLFSTTVDMLLVKETKKKPTTKYPTKQILYTTITIICGYLLVYLLGRILNPSSDQSSLLGWLFDTDPKRFSYLYGWLVHQKLFWYAMAISVILSIFNKKYIAFTCLFGFTSGLLLGEWFGHNPAGVKFGHSHYGWAIWGLIFILSLVMGYFLEKISKEKIHLNSKKLWIWAILFMFGILSIILFVRASMPTSFS